MSFTEIGQAPVARRLQMSARYPLHAAIDPAQPSWSAAPRGRVARKVRASLRRMEPVVIMAPRWSQPMSFLEGLALDLVTGQPALTCRTVRFRGMKGRSLPEVWNHLVAIFQRLIPRAEIASVPSSVADRRGFRWSLRQLLQQAHDTAPHPVALLACEVEHLPLAAIEDVVLVWEEYWEANPTERRCALLLAGSVQASWLRIGQTPQIALTDYSPQEAAAVMITRPEQQTSERVALVAQFTGGIPSIVDRFSAHFAEHGELPTSRKELLAVLGALGDEMRGVIDIVAADEGLSVRLERLRRGEPVLANEELDLPLQQAGLLRDVIASGERLVALRAPAIAALMG